MPAAATVTAANTSTCSSGFDFTEITLTLSNPVPAGTYQVVINNGSDGNTLLDNCGTSITAGTSVGFTHIVPQPIFADSVGSVACSPQQLNIYFPKKIDCGSIQADGSNFIIN